MKNVMLWAGAGQIGMAIARRMGAGMKIIVGDQKLANAEAVAQTMNGAGFDVTLLLLAAGILAAAFAILQLIRAARSGRWAA